MGISFNIDTEKGIIYAIAEGTIGRGDFRAYAINLLSDPMFHTSLGEIIEFRLAASNISDTEIEALASALTADHTSKLALVFPAGQERELGLRYKELVKDMPVEVFTDMWSAKEWVMSE